MYDPPNVPIPKRMQHLRKWRGWLVHFTVNVLPDGTPDFKSVHEYNRIQALGAGLCHLCGRALLINTEPIVFIGGPSCEKNRLFYDGPMHEDCAMYAAKVCPYLAKTTHSHAKTPPISTKDAGVEVKTLEMVAEGRPDKMGLFYSNGYRTIPVDGSLLILSQPFLKIDWDVMPQRKERHGEAQEEKTTIPENLSDNTERGEVQEAGDC